MGVGVGLKKKNQSFYSEFFDGFAHSCPLDSEVCNVFVFANVLVALEQRTEISSGPNAGTAGLSALLVLRREVKKLQSDPLTTRPRPKVSVDVK